jgi:hypothetical protein
MIEDKEMQLSLACLAKKHSQCSRALVEECQCSCHEKEQFKIESLLTLAIIFVGITLTLLF